MRRCICITCLCRLLRTGYCSGAARLTILHTVTHQVAVSVVSFAVCKMVASDVQVALRVVGEQVDMRTMVLGVDLQGQKCHKVVSEKWVSASVSPLEASCSVSDYTSIVMHCRTYWFV